MHPKMLALAAEFSGAGVSLLPYSDPRSFPIGLKRQHPRWFGSAHYW